MENQSDRQGQAEQGDQVDRAGISALRDTMSLQPARQLIWNVQPCEGVRVAVLVHEVWESVGHGMVLHTCCLAGPDGDGCRRNLDPGARLLTTFEAGSHFEAMTIYNRYLGREPYATSEPWDYQPYPDEWLAVQQGHAQPGAAPKCGNC